jgi:transketolase
VIIMAVFILLVLERPMAHRRRCGPDTVHQDPAQFDGAGDFQAHSHGRRNLHFGVREHAMGAILNCLSVSKLRPYGSGFLIFSDYARCATRLSALMEVSATPIFTHDSIGVGEDGPTHQPIEQLISLRAIPKLTVIRPADANEVLEAWKFIIQMRHHPAALMLSRQALPTLDRTRYAPASGLFKGAYVLVDAEGGKPDVLPPSGKARVAVEQASTWGWAHYEGLDGVMLGMKTFGASAPLKVLQKEFGFTTESVVAAAKEQFAKARQEMEGE